LSASLTIVSKANGRVIKLIRIFYNYNRDNFKELFVSLQTLFLQTLF